MEIGGNRPSHKMSRMEAYPMISSCLLEQGARLAPALRALLMRSGRPCTVSFSPETGSAEARTIPSEEALFAQWEAQIPHSRPEEVVVEGLGTFSVHDLPETAAKGRLAGKVVLVTGAAQGFGKEIADLLTKEGAYTLYADLDGDGAESAACAINEALGARVALGVRADVSKEEEVAQMFRTAALTFGGVDVFIPNAGIARAGSLEEMTLEAFEQMTRVNYTGYFLGVKYAAQIMKLQHRFHPTAFYDIIQINSKSGLEGSNKNFAYAGSKAGGIGLTKSFAMELCPYNIKVNAVCPGNYLDGPLWSHPEKGLLLQFLRAGKVPGAETVEDVRKAYESKVPMQRGCTPLDVVRAVLYCIEQTYETGQALPVTGGQVMLG